MTTIRTYKVNVYVELERSLERYFDGLPCLAFYAVRDFLRCHRVPVYRLLDLRFCDQLRIGSVLSIAILHTRELRSVGVSQQPLWAAARIPALALFPRPA